MKKIDIIKACSDLGVHKDGSHLGPDYILKNLDLNYINSIKEVNKIDCIKDNSIENKKKNIDYINKFNSSLYNSVCESTINKHFPIVLGGDHSISIGSALASLNTYKKMGIIWIDSHADFNTFKTTVTGNIHGLPFATVTGQNQEGLTQFHKGSFYNPKNSVLVGARSIDYPGEYENLIKAGVKIFTTEDINLYGMDSIIKQAIEIASNGTEGIHISIDIDVLDPKVAPGVSVPEINGISENDLFQAIDEIVLKKDYIKSVDLVEYNPKYDSNNITLNIAQKVLTKLIKNNLK